MKDKDFERLRAAKEKADAALSGMGDQLAEELRAAKEAYREDKSEENRERFKAAKDQVVAYRQMDRAGRPGIGVGGDAYVDGNEG